MDFTRVTTECQLSIEDLVLFLLLLLYIIHYHATVTCKILGFIQMCLGVVI